jgi:DNA-binding response OmpR family regulator
VTVPILVVDDDPVFLEAVRDSLALVAPHLAMHVATTAGEALAFLRTATDASARPAFVVLDYHLSPGDAPSLLGDIRRIDGLGDVPVLVVSQFAWEHDILAAREAGALDFRVKPSRVRELGHLLHEFWKEHAHGGCDSADRG